MCTSDPYYGRTPPPPRRAAGNLFSRSKAVHPLFSVLERMVRMGSVSLMNPPMRVSIHTSEMKHVRSPAGDTRDT